MKGKTMTGAVDVRLERWLQATVVALVLVQVLFWRNMMDADGMSYLDVAHAYAEGDWSGAVNAYWSPLYSWLLAGLIVIFHLSPQHEFAVTHALSFALFLLALAAFSFFLHQLVARTSVAEERSERGSDRAWLALAYAAFGYACISLMHVGRGGPDLLLAASFYAAMGLMLRFAMASTRQIPTGLLLGTVLGLGYLAKAVMFPVAVLALVCLGILIRRAKRGARGFALAVLAFGVISAPWIGTLSHSKGRWTYGDTGKLNYFWFVNDGAQGDPAYGRILHPPRELSRDPVVYEFAEPVRGTYPLWYDPSYWYEGVRARFDIRGQIRRLSLSTEDYFNQYWFFPCVLAVAALGLIAGRSSVRDAVASTWFVIVPAAAGFVMYTLVLVLPRHLAPFFTVGLTALGFAIGKQLDSVANDRRRSAHVLAATLAILLTVMTLAQLLFIDRRMPPGHPHMDVAAQLQKHGVTPGSRVGVIGDAIHSYWAHIASLKIVAEIRPKETIAFWAQDSAGRASQLELFRSAGAVAIVADQVPPWADKSGWVSVGNNDYFLHLFAEMPRGELLIKASESAAVTDATPQRHVVLSIHTH